MNWKQNIARLRSSLRQNPPAEWWGHPWAWVELFIVFNLAFLALDVYVAHSVNRFERTAEWIPFVFSLSAPLLLALSLVISGLHPETAAPTAPSTAGRRLARWIGVAVGTLSVGVGVAGMLFHLQSHFFGEETIRNLVYTAPFAAPLAYAGLGLLLILDRLVRSNTTEWAQWILFLALGGFCGNFVLSLADHAQNGFFHPAEWTAVGASALAVGFLLALLFSPRDRVLIAATAWLMLLESAVGLVGFLLHIEGNLGRPGENLWERFLYGAPLFAPMLFPNLALLAAIGLWTLHALRGDEPNRSTDAVPDS